VFCALLHHCRSGPKVLAGRCSWVVQALDMERRELRKVWEMWGVFRLALGERGIG